MRVCQFRHFGVARLPNGAAKAAPLLFYRREWLHANRSMVDECRIMV